MTDEEGGKRTFHGRYRQMFHRDARQARQVLKATAAGEGDEAREALGLLVGDLRSDLLSRDSYAPVFVLTLALVILTPVLSDSIGGRVATYAIAAVTLVTALRRSSIGARSLRRLTILVLVATTIGTIGAVLQNHGYSGRVTGAIATGSLTLVILITLPAVLMQTFLHTRVNANTLAAAMCAYLLLGLFFATLFSFISFVDSQPFFAQRTVIEPGDTEYFSFITMTTVGYGDLTPGTGAARAGAVATAVVGQIFLVTIVARVVGAMGNERRRGFESVESATDADRASTDGPPPEQPPETSN